jgi:pimeloyl-ACP methyl ester carboxylesterase
MSNPVITNRRVAVNGIELDVVEGRPDPGNERDAPPIVLVHGFPESAHSWRHQVPALAAAGYHVIAPDMRGYAGSTKPSNVGDYGIEQLGGDLLALLDVIGQENAVFVGHDWGALITWDLARLHPSRVAALINVSVPFVDWPAPPTDVFKATMGDNFFYILYFQPVGPVEAELDHQVPRFMKTILWAASGDHVPEGHLFPAAGNGWLDTLPAPPEELGSWCTPEDLAIYVRQFEESGFFGPCSYYRNLDANYRLVSAIPVSVMTMPIWFIGGTRDMVIARDLNGVERMRAQLPNYQGQHLIDGAGHWTQQERPAEFNEALLRFLDEFERQ